MISNQISENLCNKNRFDKAAPDYNIALKKGKFNGNVTYTSSPSKLQTRKRQIIWFSPPYRVNMKTKVVKIFMRLVDKHFLRHRL